VRSLPEQNNNKEWKSAGCPTLPKIDNVTPKKLL